MSDLHVKYLLVGGGLAVVALGVVAVARNGAVVSRA